MADLSYVTRDTTQYRYVNPFNVHLYSPDIIRIFSFDFIRTFNDCPLSLLEVFLPPPKKKRRSDTNGREMAPGTHVCLYPQPVTLIFTRSRLSDLAQSNPFIKDCYLIIIAFPAHISAFMIFFIHKKAHLVSTEGPLTLN